MSVQNLFKIASKGNLQQTNEIISSFVSEQRMKMKLPSDMIKSFAQRAIINSFLAAKDYNSALKAYKMNKNAKARDELMFALLEHKQSALFQSLIDDTQGPEITPEYNVAMLKYFLRSDKDSKRDAAYKLMSEITPNIYHLNALLQGIGQTKVDEAIDLFHRFQKYCPDLRLSVES